MLELLLGLLQTWHIIGYEGKEGQKNKRITKSVLIYRQMNNTVIVPEEKWLHLHKRFTYNRALHILPPGPGHMLHVVSI